METEVVALPLKLPETSVLRFPARGWKLFDVGVQHVHNVSTSVLRFPARGWKPIDVIVALFFLQKKLPYYASPQGDGNF